MRTKIFLIVFVISLFYQGVGQELPKVKMETEFGDILLEIDSLNAPVTATNFLHHVKTGTYKDAVFYRVVRMDNQPRNEIKIEVIQGGVYSEEQLEKIKPIRHETTKETGLLHLDGTLSMARMGPGTASTEIFICVGKQAELDFGGNRNPDGQGFAAFGKVIDGMDVVRKIQKQKDQDQALVENVKILDFSIIVK